MYKEDLALNNLQWLICHKTQSNSSNQIRMIFDMMDEKSTNTPGQYASRNYEEERQTPQISRIEASRYHIV